MEQEKNQSLAEHAIGTLQEKLGEHPIETLQEKLDVSSSTAESGTSFFYFFIFPH